MSLVKIKQEILSCQNSKKAKIYLRFFKTGKGEYGEGDKFLGLSMPQQRQISKKYQNLTIIDLQKLLKSSIHEYRMTALIILVNKYKKANELEKEKIFRLYLANTRYINNWDLVDVTCHHIVGDWLLTKDRSVLYKLAKSNNLWEKRIAIISTYTFIRAGALSDTIRLAKALVNDQHDLIHKAVGWMLREVGKKDQKIEEKFLQRYASIMPRTMLRYAIEKFDPKKRKYYLNLK